MNEEQIARFEANIERLVESTFANFFGKKLRSGDIALQLARAMEGGARTVMDGDVRPLAPDRYRILLNPQMHLYLTQRQPTLQQSLSQHLVMLAMQTGYRLLNVPIVELIGDTTIEKNQLTITAEHTDRPENSTAAMQPVAMAANPSEKRVNAFLLVNSERSVRLELDVVNIGRYRDNDLILDDPYVSRHHLQLRRRFGSYILFDVHSQGGTYVNGVIVKEHHLQTGDVVQLGKSQLVYMEDPIHEQDSALSQTDALDSQA